MTRKFLIAALAATALGAVAADARPMRHSSSGDAQAKAATRQLNEQQLASAGSTATAPGMSGPSMAAAPASDPAMGPGTMSSDAPPPPPAPDASTSPSMPTDGSTPAPADAPMPPR